MTNFNYLRDANKTQELLRIIREYQKTLGNYDLKIFTVIEQQKITEFKEKVASFLKEFDLPWPNDIGNKINEELLSPEVVNNLKPPTYEYSHDASITGCKVEALSNELFRLEEEIAHYVARIWKETLTSFDNFQNGFPFSFVATAIDFPEFFPGGAYYKKTGHAYTSATLFTNNIMDSFMDKKLLLVCEINEKNLLGMSEVDIATREENAPGLKTIGMVDREEYNYINAGYSFSGNVCTKILTPSILEQRRIQLNLKQTPSINEVILDKEKTNYTGMVLLSNGIDCLMNEYLIAIQSKETMGLSLKCLNKSLYKQSEIDDDKLLNLNNEINSFLETYEMNYGIDLTEQLLERYIKDVVEPMNYCKEVTALYMTKLNEYRQKVEQMKL